MRYLVLAGLLLVSGCATISESLRDDIGDGDFEDAIFDAEVWLKDEDNLKDGQRAQVQTLLEEASFRQARRLDTPEAYRDFLRRFQSDKFRGEATDHLARTQFVTYTRKGDTLDGYLAYLREFPTGEYPDRARERSARLVYREVEKRGTLDAYRKFREEFAATPLAQTAYAKEITMAWAAVEKGADWKTLLTFAETYPECDWAALARGLAHKLGWEEAASEDSVGCYDRFIAAFPSSPNATEAGRRSAAIVWDAVKEAGRWQGFRAFREQYPDSPHTAEAERLEWLYWGFSGPKTSWELDTTTVLADTRNPEAVALFVQALDENRDVIGGLGRDQFSVFDGPCETEVVGFEGMETTRPVDIIFVFDTTGSMGDEISGVKRAATQFAETLKLRNMDVRLGLVTYGDEIRGVYPKGGGLTDRASEFEFWVASQNAVGGGDGPENSLDALVRAQTKKFRKDSHVIFVLITDAPFHQSNKITRMTASAVADLLLGGGVMLFAVAPKDLGYESLVSRVGGKHFELDAYPDFSQLVLQISLVASKTYKIAYKPTGCRPLADAATTRVRARMGHVWAPLGRAILPQHLKSLASDTEDENRLWASAHGSGMFASSDGGLSWAPVGPEESRTKTYDLFTLDAKGAMLALPSSGTVLLSRDAGRTWEDSLSTKNVGHAVQAPTDPDLLSVLDAGMIRSTADGGSTWSGPFNAPGGATSVASALETERGLLAFSSGGRAFEWSSEGSSWHEWHIGSPPGEASDGRFLLYHHPYWPRMLFLTMPNGRLFRSLDGGGTWSAAILLSSSPAPEGGLRVDRIVFDPSQRHWVYAETNLGLFASEDSGRSWHDLSLGLSEEDRKQPLMACGAGGSLVVAGRATGNVYQLFPAANREFISGNVYFKFGSAELSPELRSYLDQLATQLAADVTATVQVEGHTDDVGTDEANMRLSLGRASNVASYLTSRGISASRVTAVGFGESRPVFPNTSDANRGQNRRVELTVLKRPGKLDPYRPPKLPLLSNVFEKVKGGRSSK